MQEGKCSNQTRALAQSLLVAIVTVVGITAAHALDVRSDNSLNEVEVGRSGSGIRDFLITDRVDPQAIDTALVFTNVADRAARVFCRTYDSQGMLLSHTRLELPALGLRFALASDLSEQLAFVGSAQCATAGHVIASAVLLGSGQLTDLPVAQSPNDSEARIRFPAIATN